MHKGYFAAGTLLATLLSGCNDSSTATTHPVADLIFYGDNIVTLDESQQSPQAVAVKDGKILAVGSQREISKLHGTSTRVENLGDKALLPGFIDGHGHFVGQAIALGLVNIAAPPVGPVDSLASLQEVLRNALAQRNLPEGSWLVGFGYEPSLFADEVRQPTRDDLDAVSTSHPIYLIHQSGHLGAVNSLALEKTGIGADTPNPDGGVIVRREGSSEPNGVLEEKASWTIFYSLPKPPVEAVFALLDKAQDYYAGYGITTAQEGRASDEQFHLLNAYANAGKLKLDVVTYPDIETGANALTGDTPFGQYINHHKLGGVKISLDGSMQGFTAWTQQPYYKPPHDLPADHRGYPAYPQAQVTAFFEQARDHDWQMLVHANADAAAQQMLDTIEAVFPDAATIARKRHTMIHAQLATEEQLDSMARLGVIPSFMSPHTFYYGDYHASDVLGAERAARIDPLKWAEDRGIRFNTHNDAPVFPPDVMRMVWASVNRLSRSGQVIGAEQRISVEQALRAVTIDAAYMYSEEALKGTITPGKLADLVVLENNPMTAPVESLKDIRILATYKDGQQIFHHPAGQTP